jgi:hypothetical protein
MINTPLPSSLFQGPLQGVGGVSPPAPPGGESKKVSPLTEKTVGERTFRSLGCSTDAVNRAFNEDRAS